MKKIIVFFLLPLFFSCQKEYVLEAELEIVYDHTQHFLGDVLDDSINATAIRRHVEAVYRCVNEWEDSIFIPIGIPHLTNSHLEANIESRNTLRTSVSCGYCEQNRSGAFAPGDTIVINIGTNIVPNNYDDNEWLKNIPLNELIMKININTDSLHAMKSHLTIPRIVFKNDTSKAIIDPWRKK